MTNNPKDKKVSLSSWNYGSFSLCNPYYNVSDIKSKPIKIYQNQYSNNIYKIDGKKEKIVKNIYFENLDYMNYINRDNNNESNYKRPNSANQNKINNKSNEFNII